MKRLSSVVLAAAALCMVAAPSAKAQGTLRYGFSAGLLMPTSTYKQGDKLGWVGGVGATYWLPGNFGVRGELSYSQTSHDSATFGAAGHTKLIGGMASAVYALNPASAPARIILSAGLGFYNVKGDANGVSAPSSTKVGFGGGAAVAFKLGTGSTRLVVAGRYQSVSTSPSSLSFIPITVGLSFGK